jgi:adenylate cyclase
MMVDVPDLEAAGLLEDAADEDARAERAELLQRLLEDGFTLAELQDAARSGRLALLPVDRVLHREDARYTSVEIAERTGLPLDFLNRLWRSLGLAATEEAHVAYDEADLQAAQGLSNFRAAGLDEDTLCLISQVLGHGMSRLSETILQEVGEALLRAGDSEMTLGLRYAQATEQLVPPLTPLLGYVLGVHLREQVKAAVVTQAELTAGRYEGTREMTICFADLVGFTRFGEGVPPEQLGSATRRLTELAIQAARPPVRLVKMIGDAALLVSPQPEPLVEAALALVAEVEHDGDAMPPLRVGVASGPAVSDSGDWFGAPVNLASRVTNVARPATVLATRSVRDAVPSSFAWSYAGKRHFKGIRSEVELYRARAQQAETTQGSVPAG